MRARRKGGSCPKIKPGPDIGKGRGREARDYRAGIGKRVWIAPRFFDKLGEKRSRRALPGTFCPTEARKRNI